MPHSPPLYIKHYAVQLAEAQKEIADAMDILSPIPGDTLNERLRAFVIMSAELEVEWRKLNDRRDISK